MVRQIKFEQGCRSLQLLFLGQFFGEWGDHRRRFRTGWGCFRYNFNSFNLWSLLVSIMLFDKNSMTLNHLSGIPRHVLSWDSV